MCGVEWQWRVCGVGCTVGVWCGMWRLRCDGIGLDDEYVDDVVNVDVEAAVYVDESYGDVGVGVGDGDVARLAFRRALQVLAVCAYYK